MNLKAFHTTFRFIYKILVRYNITMEKVNIGLDDNSITESAKILNSILADEYVLYTKVRNFHWNVKGPHFNDLHKFFEELYEELNGAIDEIAEKVRMLGCKALGSLDEMLSNASLKESKDELDSNAMITELLNDYETLIKKIREDIEKIDDLDNVGVEDFLTGLLQDHEKRAWMLRSMMN